MQNPNIELIRQCMRRCVPFVIGIFSTRISAAPAVLQLLLFVAHRSKSFSIYVDAHQYMRIYLYSARAQGHTEEITAFKTEFTTVSINYLKHGTSFLFHL